MVGVMPKGHRDRERDAEIWRLFRHQGMSARAIGALYGLADNAVHQVLRKERLRRNDPWRSRMGRPSTLSLHPQPGYVTPAERDDTSGERCACGLRIDAEHRPENCDLRFGAVAVSTRRRPVEYP
jgi:hypothetical protein